MFVVILNWLHPVEFLNATLSLFSFLHALFELHIQIQESSYAALHSLMTSLYFSYVTSYSVAESKYVQWHS